MGSSDQRWATVTDTFRGRSPLLLGVVSAVVGGALLAVGAIAVIRAGLGGSWDQPVVDVAGLSHTALLGAAEIAAGVVIALAGLTDTRASVLLCATALAMSGVIVLAEPEELHRRLAVSRAHGWWVLGLAIALLLAVLLTPDTATATQWSAAGPDTSDRYDRA